jgi:hypothetical protein
MYCFGPDGKHSKIIPNVFGGHHISMNTSPKKKEGP